MGVLRRDEIMLLFGCVVSRRNNVIVWVCCVETK